MFAASVSSIFRAFTHRALGSQALGCWHAYIQVQSQAIRVYGIVHIVRRRKPILDGGTIPQE